MRTHIALFYVLGGYFALTCITYVVWTDLATGTIEPFGIVGLTFATAFVGLLAFYLQRSHRAQGGLLPEDRLEADIDDGDPEIGEFPAQSWWPIVLAAAIALGFLGMAIGYWLTLIGIGIAVISIIGWTFEMYRGYFAR